MMPMCTCTRRALRAACQAGSFPGPPHHPSHLAGPQVLLHFVKVVLEPLALLRLEVDKGRAVCPDDCNEGRGRGGGGDAPRGVCEWPRRGSWSGAPTRATDASGGWAPRNAARRRVSRAPGGARTNDLLLLCVPVGRHGGGGSADRRAATKAPGGNERVARAPRATRGGSRARAAATSRAACARERRGGVAGCGFCRGAALGAGALGVLGVRTASTRCEVPENTTLRAWPTPPPWNTRRCARGAPACRRAPPSQPPPRAAAARLPAPRRGGRPWPPRTTPPPPPRRRRRR